MTGAAAFRPFAAAVLLRRGGVATLWGLAALPPLHLVLGGRRGGVYAIEIFAVAAAFLLFWRQGFRLRSATTLTMLGVYLLASLPATIHTTDLPRHIYGVLQFLFAGLLLYAITAPAMRRATLDEFTGLLPLPFVLIALTVLAGAWSQDLIASAGRKVETLHGGSNFLASMLLLGLCVPLATALGARRRNHRLLSQLAFALIAAALCATGSRAAMITAPLGCLLTFVLLKRYRATSWARIGAACGVLAATLIVLSPFLIEMVRAGRFHDVLGQRNFLARIELFAVYRDQFLDHPWIGNGHMNGRASPLLALLGEGGTQGGAVVWGAHVQAHNWLLQTLADSGVIGALAFIAFLIACGRVFIRGAARPNPWQPTAAGLLAGWMMAVIHGLVEPNFHGKPFIYLLALNVGVGEQICRSGALHSYALNRSGGHRAAEKRPDHMSTEP